MAQSEGRGGEENHCTTAAQMDRMDAYRVCGCKIEKGKMMDLPHTPRKTRIAPFDAFKKVGSAPRGGYYSTVI
jgi:hypothetical protein